LCILFSPFLISGRIHHVNKLTSKIAVQFLNIDAKSAMGTAQGNKHSILFLPAEVGLKVGLKLSRILLHQDQE